LDASGLKNVASGARIPPVKRRSRKEAPASQHCACDAGDYITARPKPVGGSRLVCTDSG